MHLAEGRRSNTPTDVVHMTGNLSLMEIVKKVEDSTTFKVLELSSGGDKHRILLYKNGFDELEKDTYTNKPFLEAIRERETVLLKITELKSKEAEEMGRGRYSPKRVTREGNKIIFTAECSDGYFYSCSWSLTPPTDEPDEPLNF